MAKLTKAEWKSHAAAVALLDKGRALTDAECKQVFRDWNPGAVNDQTSNGVFFTPVELAQDFHLEIPQSGTVVDLCAGTGTLAYFGTGRHWYEQTRPRFERIICVERSPAFVAVGKRLLPEATWICGDVLDADVWKKIGAVDFAFCNPPFGRMMQSLFDAPRYDGAEAEFKVLDVAAMLAPSGAAIIPRQSAPFDSIGSFDRRPSAKYAAFQKAVGVTLDGGVGIDPEYHRSGWKGVSPSVEIVAWDFENHNDTPRPLPQPAHQLAMAI